MFGLGDTKVVIRTDAQGRRAVVVKRGLLGPREAGPLPAKVAAFVRDLPIAGGCIRITPPRRGSRRSRLVFSRGFSERLAQRIRNYAASLT